MGVVGWYQSRMQAVPITAISSLIAQKWKLDTTTTLFLSQIITWVLTFNVWNLTVDWAQMSWWWVGIPVTIGAVYLCYQQRSLKLVESEENLLRIYDKGAIDDVCFYIKE